MKIRLSIKFKAIFLTIIFLLNTVVGFACTVGIDMGFNRGHHDDHSSVAKNTPHSHPPGTKSTAISTNMQHLPHITKKKKTKIKRTTVARMR